MISRKYFLYLRKQPNFFFQARKQYSDLFLIFSKKSDSPHYVVIVPKKTVQLATKRNECKRKIYSLIQKLILSYELKDYDFAIVLKKSVSSVTDIEKEFRFLASVLTKQDE